MPFDVILGLPDDVKPAGSLLLAKAGWPENDLIWRLHFIPEPTIELLQGVSGDCLSTSPDGKWMAYCPRDDASPTGQWLIVESADRQQTNKVPTENVFSFGQMWLNNKQLIFLFAQPERTGPRPMVVINPFTGEQTELSSDFPELYPPDQGMGRMGFNIADLVYDPSLDLVIYPSSRGLNTYFIVWDRRANAMLAKIENPSGIFGYFPVWSPDGKQVVFPVIHYIEKNRRSEWFSVSRTGEARQITHFGDYFEIANIAYAPAWSPDSKKLAFLLETTPNLCPTTGMHLAILDIETEQVTNTCFLVSKDYGANPPHWSLDSRFLVTMDIWGDDERYRQLLIDVEIGYAYDITEFTLGSAYGWLDFP
jgi:hypothetical protein